VSEHQHHRLLNDKVVHSDPSIIRRRSGIRLHEFFHEDIFESKLRRLASGYKKRYGDLLEYDVEEEIQALKKYREELANYVVDAVEFMKSVREENVSVLVEGGQALSEHYTMSTTFCLFRPKWH
jgi:adenylosuccinate synthase